MKDIKSNKKNIIKYNKNIKKKVYYSYYKEHRKGFKVTLNNVSSNNGKPKINLPLSLDDSL